MPGESSTWIVSSVGSGVDEVKATPNCAWVALVATSVVMTTGASSSPGIGGDGVLRDFCDRLDRARTMREAGLVEEAAGWFWSSVASEKRW